MAIMTDAEVEAAIGDLGQDPGAPPISFVRPGAEEAIKGFVGWPIERAQVTRYYDGSGGKELVLRGLMYVVNDGTLEVKIDSAGAYGQNADAFDDDALTKGDDYALVIDDPGGSYSKSGILIKLGNTGSWPSDYTDRNRRGLSYRRHASWPRGDGNIKVTCNYGFQAADMPADIKMAVAEAVTIFRNMVKRGVLVTSESLGDYSWGGTFNQMGEFADIRKRLGRYRDLGV